MFEYGTAPKPAFLVVTGLHASGKTTAATHFSTFGYLAHAEIGWALRQTLLSKDPESATLFGQDLVWFDEAILQLELRRDSFIEQLPELPHCVETWHIGNLAYVCPRSPSLTRRFEEALLNQAQKFRPRFVVTAISYNCFEKRYRLTDKNPRELYEFYLEIHDRIIFYLDRFTMPYRIVENDSNITEFLEKLSEAILQLS